MGRERHRGESQNQNKKPQGQFYGTRHGATFSGKSDKVKTARRAAKAIRWCELDRMLQDYPLTPHKDRCTPHPAQLSSHEFHPCVIFFRLRKMLQRNKTMSL